jgi:L-iditol 2-dehydrogenase
MSTQTISLAGFESPDSMKVNVMTALAASRVEDRLVPEVGHGDVLVRVTAVGVCGSDVHWFQEGHIGDLHVDGPIVLGHEASGTVVEIAADVDRSLLGRRVSIEPGVPCRRCRQCHVGRYNLCPDMRFMATPPIDGAFAQYVVMPADYVYPIPDDVSDDVAALLEPLSVGIWASRRGDVQPGARVLVTGAGPIGLLAGQVARAFGAVEVTITDVSDERLAVARSLGLSAVPAGTDLGSDFDTTLECSGAQAAVDAAARATGRGGHLVLVGMGASSVTLPTSLLQAKEATVTGTFRYANTWPLALDLARYGRVDVQSLVTHHFDLDHVSTALTPSEIPGSIKAVVHPHGL